MRIQIALLAIAKGDEDSLAAVAATEGKPALQLHTEDSLAINMLGKKSTPDTESGCHSQ